MVLILLVLLFALSFCCFLLCRRPIIYVQQPLPAIEEYKVFPVPTPTTFVSGVRLPIVGISCVSGAAPNPAHPYLLAVEGGWVNH